jgi:hypothetical protein
MLQSPYFVQECPVCGRPLRVRVVDLGRRVTCQHCLGRFTASDPALRRGPATERQGGLSRRVERLLRMPVRRVGADRQAAVTPGG